MDHKHCTYLPLEIATEWKMVSKPDSGTPLHHRIMTMDLENYEVILVGSPKE